MEKEELEALVNGILESLTPEQREKLKGCTSLEEVLGLASEEGVELPAELLEAVAGGRITYIGDKNWGVVNDRNDLVIEVLYGDGPDETDDIKALATELGRSTEFVPFAQIEKNSGVVTNEWNPFEH